MHIIRYIGKMSYDIINSDSKKFSPHHPDIFIKCAGD